MAMYRIIYEDRNNGAGEIKTLTVAGQGIKGVLTAFENAHKGEKFRLYKIEEVVE